MAEEVLIKIELEKGQGEKQVDDMTKKIVGLQSANKELVKQNKELEKSGKENSQQYIENTRQIEINKQKITESIASRKGLVQALVAEDKSLKGLRIRNAELLKQRESISTSTAKGRQQIEAINKEMDRNTKTIIKNSNAQEKQRFNIGNYSSALDKIIPGLSGMTQGIAATTRASLAFIATPIGAVLAAVALAILAVKEYLTGSEEGMDKFAKVSAQASAVLSVLMGTLREIGGALVAFAEGRFTDGVKGLSDAFSGMGDKIEKAVRNAGELADIFDTLDELRLRNQVRNDEEENAIKNLIIQSRARNKTDQERADLLRQASELEKKITGEKLALQLAEINASTRQFLVDSNRLDLEQRLGETTVEFTKRIINDQSLLVSGRQKLADQYGVYNTLLDNQANIQEKISNQENALLDKQQERLAKQLEMNAAVDAYLKKFLDSLDAPRIAFEEEQRRAEERSQMAEDFLTQMGVNTNISLDLAQREHDRKKQLIEQENAFRRKSLEMKKGFDEAALQSSVGLFGAMSGLFKKESAEQKTFGLLSIAINAAVGVSNAVKAGSGVPWPANLAAILSGVTAVLAGIAQAKSLLKFAEGGLVPGFAGGGLSGTRIMSHHGTPINRSNGDNRLATVKTGEVILNRQQQRALGGDDVFRRIGVPGFATGGTIETTATRVAASAAQDRLDMNQLAGLLNNVRSVLVLQDFEAVQTQKQQIINKAQVI